MSHWLNFCFSIISLEILKLGCSKIACLSLIPRQISSMYILLTLAYFQGCYIGHWPDLTLYLIYWVILLIMKLGSFNFAWRFPPTTRRSFSMCMVDLNLLSRSLKVIDLISQYTVNLGIIDASLLKNLDLL
jgi:hypothetical protein